MKLKFSKRYAKLWGQEAAELIYMRILDSENIDSDLLEYDTKTLDGTYYKLPKGRLIQLFFIGDKGIPFCTIRRYTPEKYKYYGKNVGEIFEIERT